MSEMLSAENVIDIPSSDEDNNDSDNWVKPEPEVVDLTWRNQTEKNHVDRQAGKPYSCDKCYRKYWSPTVLANHLRNFHGFNVTFEKETKRQKTKKVSETTRTCPMCGKSFEKSLDFGTHMTQCNAEPDNVMCSIPSLTDYACDFCDQKFFSYAGKNAHVDREHRNLEFVCDSCEISFATQKDLKTHGETFHGEVQADRKCAGRIRCKYCDVSFTKSNESSHRLKCKFKKRTVQPKLIPSQNAKKGKLEVAYATKPIPTAKPKNVCVLCSQSFANALDLREHMKKCKAVPESDKKYFCDFCDMSFFSFQGHKKHINTYHYGKGIGDTKKVETSSDHTNDNDETGSVFTTCRKCNMDFATEYDLKQHEFSEHFKSNSPKDPTKSEKPGNPGKPVAAKEDNISESDRISADLKCPRCDRSFYTHKGLKAHMITDHSLSTTLPRKQKAQRLTVCDICGKAFAIAEDLTSHKLCVHHDFAENSEHKITVYDDSAFSKKPKIGEVRSLADTEEVNIKEEPICIKEEVLPD